MSKTPKRKRLRINEVSPAASVVLIIVMIFLALVILRPLALVIIISISSTESLARNGFTYFPTSFSIEAYRFLFRAGDTIFRSYGNTIFYTVVGTLLSLFVMSMFAYVLSLKAFKPRRAITFIAFFTTLFYGGLVPEYILYTQYLHFNNTIWIFLLPNVVNAFYVIILRTFIQTSIPDSLYESAKIDGANDWTIYTRIVLPLSKAGLATIALFNVVERWNNWFTGLLYVENAKLVPIMTYLQRIQKDLEYLKRNMDIAGPDVVELMKNMPSESARMAIAVIAVAPLMVMYPFFQKYFVKGMTIGSVKG